MASRARMCVSVYSPFSELPEVDGVKVNAGTRGRPPLPRRIHAARTVLYPRPTLFGYCGFASASGNVPRPWARAARPRITRPTLFRIMTSSPRPNLLTQGDERAPDLSIIIINWRMGKDVAGVLPSIERHEHRCLVEVVLVNKPSGDGTEALVAEKHPWVRLIPHEVFGIAEMRNVGIRHARGRYLLMLDADTELFDGCLDALVDFMEARPSVGGCGGHTTRPNGELEYNVKRFYSLSTILVRRSPLERLWPDNPWNRWHLMKDKDHSKPFEGDWMAGACFLMRRAAVEQVGLFDQHYYFGFEDVDWCWRAKRLGWRIAFNPDARIVHKVQRMSARGLNKMAWEHLKSGVRFWWKARHQGLTWAVAERPEVPRRRAPRPSPAMLERPDLSVVVINLNGRKLLQDCLESLREAAPNHRLEVIVVDNGSRDGSPDMVRSGFPEAKLIVNDRNLGFTKANNQGIAISTGRYVMMLNNDTRVLPGAFSEAIRFLDAEGAEIGCCGLKLLNEDGSLQLSCRRFPSFSQAIFNRYSLLTRLFPNNRFSRAYLMTDATHDTVQDVDWVSGACLMARREVVDQIGMLDERFFMYSEDVDYCYRVWQAGWRVTYYPGAQVYHLIGQDTRKVRFKLTIERHKSMYRFYKKHYSREILFLDAVTAMMVALRCANQLALEFVRKVLLPERAS